MSHIKLPPTPNPEQAKGVTVEEIGAVAAHASGLMCSDLSPSHQKFEGFLMHEEHSVENLQFIVWYRSYCERFNALAPEYQALSDPPIDRFTFNTPAGSIRTTASSVRGKDDPWYKRLVQRRFSSASSQNRKDEEATMEGLGFGEVGMEERIVKDKQIDQDDNVSLHSAAAPDSPAFSDSKAFPSTNKNKGPLARVSTINDDSSSLNSENMDRKSKKFPSLRFAQLAPLISKKSRELPEDTPLPFLDEIKLVLTTFILPGAAKELNLDARLRRHILRSLEPTLEDGTKGPPVTTHPDVFKEVASHTYGLMERSLPHYMQWAKGNINTPKMLFWYVLSATRHSAHSLTTRVSVPRYGVGATDFAIGVMLAMLIMYRAHSRWYRIFSFLFIQFGRRHFTSSDCKTRLTTFQPTQARCSSIRPRDTSAPKFMVELPVNSTRTHRAPAARRKFCSSDTLTCSWELTSEVESVNSAPAFTASHNTEANKQKSDLHASLPFLFDDAPPTNSSETWASTASTAAATTKKGATFRTKWKVAWRGSDGKRIKVFGPERVVEDPYIKEIHNKQIKEILIVGAVVTILLEIMFVALPEQARRI
ncbi:hypothetical protein P7C70_g2391, partial [Phenoliferia sp. Uapishka_3]